MGEEHIKDIIVALINNGMYISECSNKENAKKIARMIKIIKHELKDDYDDY
ncbi:MAG: hypothetical protein RR898_04380 [Clostridium sp.]|uniref:hypothetical protein n=1 Tax=Clostridium sp. TaxID=1506 RepID=UPI002FC7FED3